LYEIKHERFASQAMLMKRWLIVCCVMVVIFQRGVNAQKSSASFRLVESPGEHLDVKFDDRNVVRFINRPHDGSTDDSHYMSFKPFHQVFDPETGTVLLSSGVHPKTKEFKFPHHRGLFFGFNRISYGDGKTADIWHGTKGVFSSCDKVVDRTANETSASHTAAISWNGEDGITFANELRTVTVFNLDGGTQLDWSTSLTTPLERVRLDGDPQHAGFHFRASQEVAQSTAKQTYYLRPDGKGKEGETRNWDPKKKDERTINLPWNAMSFVVQEKRYTVLRINHPENPQETRGSERDYGRFGDYFEYELTPSHPLNLRYRIWVQSGEMTKEQCEKMAQSFVVSKS
jgi:Methane oxygenase PmoA